VALASQYNSLLTDISEVSWSECGRLTLLAGNPVTTTDITGATKIYYAPFDGNVFNTYHTAITFRDVYRWTTDLELDISETSDYPANANFDVFMYHLSTSTDHNFLSLVTVEWTTDLTRAEELMDSYGIYTRTGFNPGFYKYLGTFRTVAAGQTEDSQTRRFLANYYNAVPKEMYCNETTQNTTTTDTPALWNASITNNQLGFVIPQPYGVVVDFGISAQLRPSTDDDYARCLLYIDGAAIPTVELINENMYNVRTGMWHPYKVATGYHYVNCYIDGTDGGTATFDDLVLSAMVMV
jgi:hypothetical protein